MSLRVVDVVEAISSRMIGGLDRSAGCSDYLRTNITFDSPICSIVSLLIELHE